jgi:LytS/YehU family sensor histidine kinase
MKLSNIMRYVTDDVTQLQVPLQSEVDCITDYIDLQKLRLSDRTQVDYSVTGDLEMKNISPLLLMTFVENVFKYGVSAHEPSPIVIRISVDGKATTLFCSNRIFNTQAKMERTGIGISNTRQRLEHLYPGKHSLDIKEENGFYNVMLKLYA